MMSKRFSCPRAFGLALAACFSLFSILNLAAADWPTYMRGNDRIGSTAEQLRFPLAEQWRIVSVEAPEKANTGPEGREIEGKLLRHRIDFDDAFHVAVAGKRVFYGSSVDHQVRCLDLESGDEVWNFYTGAAVRLAPTIFEGRVYIGSDDGQAYCLDASDGSVVWKRRAGPGDDMMLGRGQMISRWPVRTGILVQKGEDGGAIAYFGAGIFPHELIYLYAVDARTGEVVWKVDNISEESAGRNDLSPQGYFLANEELLVIPSGRSLPAVLDRMTGESVYKAKAAWRTDAGGVVGGTQALLADDQIYVWGAHHIFALDQKEGKVGFGWFAGRQMAVSGDAAYVANGEKVARLDRAQYAVWSGKRHALDMEIYDLNRGLRGATDPGEIKEKIAAVQDRIEELGQEGVIWSTESPCESRLIVAGSTLFAGGEDRVSAFDIATGAEAWSAAVEGEARGLVVANGKLIVSTTTGDVHCFGSGDAAGASRVAVKGTSAATSKNPFPADEFTGLYERAAEEILRETGVKRGFCLVAGSERGRLAYELAKRSELEIYGVEPDAAKVRESRERLSEAGVYGNRITVHHADLDSIPYANYFANLIVSDAVLLSGELESVGEPERIARHLKPIGGVACLGRPAGGGAMETLSESERDSWLVTLGMGPGSTFETHGAWSVLRRGALPGAGSWTHQYGEPGNTATSDDERVRGGLGVLWFGDPGEGKMVNRHEGAVGPLAVNGRLFVQGQTRIMAYDAYNGLFLWERENPDAIRTGVFQNENPGNLAASEFRLYFMERDKCHEIDAATGELKRSHRLPEKLSGGGSHEWGYVSFHNGMLFGTATMRTELEEKQRRRGKVTEDMTDGLFAIDAEKGIHKWDYRGGTIAHHTVAIGEDAIYFIDSTITSEERAAILGQDKSRFANLTPDEVKKEEARLKAQDVRLAVAVDANTGAVKWTTPVDVTDCSDFGTGGGKLTLIYKDGVLLLGGANANGHYWKQFMEGEFEKRRLVALSAEDGSVLWKKDANYRHRPIIVRDEVFAEPWAFNLRTGEQRMRENPVTGEPEPWSIMRSGHHCGMMAASPNMLMFRSGFTGFYDLEKDIGTEHFAGHRTGCWINAIPANGLVSIPEASAGCVCLFSISSTIVMEPVADREDWAIFSSTGAKLPVKRMALNLGAPGDRRAADGTPWLAYPRPKPEKETGLDLALDFGDEFYAGGKFDAINSYGLEVRGEGPSWVYGSWASGLKRFTIPLLGEKDAPARYRVRLHFSGGNGGAAGSDARAIDIKLQGKTVLEGFAVSGGDPSVRELSGIEVEKDLVVEVAPQSGNPSATGLPLLSGIEVVRM